MHLKIKIWEIIKSNYAKMCWKVWSWNKVCERTKIIRHLNLNIRIALDSHNKNPIHQIEPSRATSHLMIVMQRSRFTPSFDNCCFHFYLTSQGVDREQKVVEKFNDSLIIEIPRGHRNIDFVKKKSFSRQRKNREAYEKQSLESTLAPGNCAQIMARW